MIARVLAAVDGSSRAPYVVETATDLVSRYGAAFYLLRTIEVPPEFPAAAAGIPQDKLPAHLAVVATNELAALARGANAAVAKILVRVGQPWRTILEVGDELDADLIVMGSHGYYGLDRVLGTTAGKVANLAGRNVLIVHDRNRRSAP